MNIFKSYDCFFDSRLYQNTKRFCIGLIALIIALAFMMMVTNENDLWAKLMAVSFILAGIVLLCLGILELNWIMNDNECSAIDYPSLVSMLIFGSICTLGGGVAMIYFNNAITHFIAWLMPQIPSVAAGLVRHIVTGS
jgi:hypothetical protein